MGGCPIDWPLDIIGRDQSSGKIYQICRHWKNREEWECANGWTRARNATNCEFTKNGKENLTIEFENSNNQSSTVSISVTTEVVTQPPRADPCTIYTYFETIPNQTFKLQEAAVDTLKLWEKVWSIQGWHPVILTVQDAKRHQNYSYFRDRFSSFPTINAKEYELACFMRHVAMATVGGGFLSDYDVLPLYIPRCVKPLSSGKYTVIDRHIPSLVSASGQEYTRIAGLMAEFKWKDHPNLFNQSGRQHVSDMLVMKKLTEDKMAMSYSLVLDAKYIVLGDLSCNELVKDGTVSGGLPSRPWAVHFSHQTLSKVRKDYHFPGWLRSKLNQNVEEKRALFMSEVYNVYCWNCLSKYGINCA